MSEETKSCMTCAYSYYLTDAHDNPTEQCCSNDKYNAPEYTHEMLMEAWDKGNLEQHIFAQLQYEVLNCKAVRRLTGFTNTPADFRGKVISLDAIRETSPLYEIVMAA